MTAAAEEGVSEVAALEPTAPEAVVVAGAAAGLALFVQKSFRRVPYL